MRLLLYRCDVVIDSCERDPYVAGNDVGIAGVLGVEHTVTTTMDMMMMMVTTTMMYSYLKKMPAHWGQAYIYTITKNPPSTKRQTS